MAVGNLRYFIEVLGCIGWKEVELPKDNCSRLNRLKMRSDLGLEDKTEGIVLIKKDGSMVVYKVSEKPYK